MKKQEKLLQTYSFLIFQNMNIPTKIIKITRFTRNHETLRKMP